MANCEIALKEWAAVCSALEVGRQCVLLRTGGIAEGPRGFEIDHERFWLFPTRFHQESSEIAEDARDLLASLEPPMAGLVEIGLLAEVVAVARIDDEDRLPELSGFHVLSPETLAKRFHYREPGLFAILVRVHRRAETAVIPDSPHFAGCRSWVDLPCPIDERGLSPTVDDETFAAVENRFLAATRRLG